MPAFRGFLFLLWAFCVVNITTNWNELNFEESPKASKAIRNWILLMVFIFLHIYPTFFFCYWSNINVINIYSPFLSLLLCVHFFSGHMEAEKKLLSMIFDERFGNLCINPNVIYAWYEVTLINATNTAIVCDPKHPHDAIMKHIYWIFNHFYKNSTMPVNLFSFRDLHTFIICFFFSCCSVFLFIFIFLFLKDRTKTTRHCANKVIKPNESIIARNAEHCL